MVGGSWNIRGEHADSSQKGNQHDYKKCTQKVCQAFSPFVRQQLLKVTFKVPSLHFAILFPGELSPTIKKKTERSREAGVEVLSKRCLLGEVFPPHQSSVGVWLPRLVS